MRENKYKKMTNEEFKNLSDEEFKDYVAQFKAEFPSHNRKIDEITIPTMLKPAEVIAIAKEYHRKNDSWGWVNEDIAQLRFDEAYTFKVDLNNRNNDDIRPAWRVVVDVPENPFLFEDYTLIISDRDKKVMGQLDPNGHPVDIEF